MDHDAESVHGVLQAAGHAYLRGYSVEVFCGGGVADCGHDVDIP